MTQQDDIFSVIARTARRDAVAIRDAHSAWTYGELLDTAEAIARGLRRSPVPPGARMCILSRQDPRALVLWLGAARAGVTPVILDPDAPRDVLDERLGRLRPAWTVTADGIADLAVDGRPGDIPLPSPGCPVLLLHTSGTTGNSKAAVFTHTATLHQLRAYADYLGITADDVFLTTFPLFHSGGLRSTALTALASGAQCVLESAFDGATFLDRLRATRATLFVHTEAMLASLLEQPQSASDRDHRVWRSPGSGRCPSIEEFEQRFGIALLPNYGSSELGSISGVRHDVPPAERRRRREAHPEATYAGTPLGDDVQVRIAGSGEILLRSPGAFAGYLGNAEQTESAFTDGWFRTGDLGILDGDGLYFVDRLSEVAWRDGVAIVTRRIEDALTAHPDIREAAVVLDSGVIVAVVALSDGAALQPDAILQWCRESLPADHVPRQVEVRDRLPRGPSGRLLKRLLRDSPRGPR